MADEMAQNQLRELLAEFEGRLNQRFDRIDERFNQVDGRFNQVDQRLAGLESGQHPSRLLSRPWTHGYPLESRS